MNKLVEAGKRGRGQPPKEPPPDAAERIRALAADGFSMRGVAAGLGVVQDTLRKWFDHDQALKEAFELGRERERHVLHNVLYRAAVEDGNLTAAMFLLKSRHGYKEGQDPSEAGGRVTINFSLPAAMPAANFMTVSHDSNA
ncbi:hypothetical protein SAMN06265795_12343 [Noviherbaspirillum humi]|uniref:Homeodomain-like domain-containing protein n=1 Tax=Noviherbaspirillum humi TaxID=1688639 RepID=A0A239LI96_9BURK|nr:hypothetical protein [Noviherbaspirillum humi]SNT30397.1 hypothetical protein SAMN06265795_12343 [Noviherbaspirillum humi]